MLELFVQIEKIKTTSSCNKRIVMSPYDFNYYHPQKTIFLKGMEYLVWEAESPYRIRAFYYIPVKLYPRDFSVNYKLLKYLTESLHARSVC